MSVTEVQERVVQMQAQFAQRLDQLDTAITEVNELTPNADEALIAYFDLGEKTIEALDNAINILDEGEDSTEG